MALPDVDDTDEIDRMMLDDINGKKFKNVGLRVNVLHRKKHRFC